MLLDRFRCLMVEAAGIEPASISAPQTVLHT